MGFDVVCVEECFKFVNDCFSCWMIVGNNGLYGCVLRVSFWCNKYYDMMIVIMKL